MRRRCERDWNREPAMVGLALRAALSLSGDHAENQAGSEIWLHLFRSFRSSRARGYTFVKVR